MKSYRAQLAKINAGQSVSYRAFGSRPASLSVAMRAMDFPTQFTEVSSPHEDQDWTQGCQGVASDGKHWFFSSNGSVIGNSPKAIYTFNMGMPLSDDDIVHTFVVGSQVTAPPGGVHHVGQCFCYSGKIYVDHFGINGEPHVLVLNNNNGQLSFDRWILLDKIDGQRIVLVAINSWDSTFVTSLPQGAIDRLFFHEMASGHYLQRAVTLNPPINDGGFIQGGAFSNGHVYIASGNQDIPGTGQKYQYVYGYSVLNGHLLNSIAVLAEDSGQELEGMCVQPTTSNGQPVQVHVVLLENIAIAKDNIFFKSFAANAPDLV